MLGFKLAEALSLTGLWAGLELRQLGENALLQLIQTGAAGRGNRHHGEGAGVPA